MRKIIFCHSKILHVIGLEEIMREHADDLRGEIISDESRERVLSQLEEFKDEESVRYRSMRSIYDETNIMFSEFCLLSDKELM